MQLLENNSLIFIILNFPNGRADFKRAKNQNTSFSWFALNWRYMPKKMHKEIK